MLNIPAKVMGNIAFEDCFNQQIQSALQATCWNEVLTSASVQMRTFTSAKFQVIERLLLAESGP